MEIPRDLGEGEQQAALPGVLPVEPVQETLPGFTAPPELSLHKRYTAFGKELQRDGKHYGDMVDENAANCAAFALNAADEHAKWVLMLAHVK